MFTLCRPYFYRECVQKSCRVDRNNPSAAHVVSFPSVCGCSVGGTLKPYYLVRPLLPLPRLPCPPNTTHPLPISSAGTTALVGRSARAPSVSSSKVCFSSSPFFLLPPNLNSFFFATGTNLLNSQTVAIKFVSRNPLLCLLVSPLTWLTQLPPRNLERPRLPS